MVFCEGNLFDNWSLEATLMSPLTLNDSPTLGAWSGGCWASLNTCWYSMESFAHDKNTNGSLLRSDCRQRIPIKKKKCTVIREKCCRWGDSKLKRPKSARGIYAYLTLVNFCGTPVWQRFCPFLTLCLYLLLRPCVPQKMHMVCKVFWCPKHGYQNPQEEHNWNKNVQNISHKLKKLMAFSLE